MGAEELRYLTLSQAASMVRDKKVSPVELTEAMLEVIEKTNSKLNAFITLTPEKALEGAKAAEAKAAAGGGPPLLGVPIALKDLYQTKGIRTTANSLVLENWVPDEDATTTRLLAEAGTILLGKLTMHEYAFGAPDFSHKFQPARNPWNPARQPGGSSSGTGAALAAGLCYGSLGSDTGGSIRGPASFCGISGLKPTYGRVSRYGVVPLSWSLDHAGPMARTVEDTALLMQAIAGFDPKDPASADVPVDDYTAGLERGVSGMTFGVPRAWFDEFEGTNPEVIAAFEAALKVLEGEGAKIVEVDSAPFMNARHANTIILLAEAGAYHEETLRNHPELLGASVRDRVMEGAFYSAVDYVQAQRARTVLSAQINAILQDVDVILSPSAAQPADAFEGLDPTARNRMPAYTSPFNTTGLPSMSIPTGFSRDGLPLGLQISGRAFDEATVLRVARSHERNTDWHERHPQI